MTTIAYTANGLDDYAEDKRFNCFLGQGQTIAVIDTGIDLDHPRFGPDSNNNGISDRIVLSNLDFLSSDKSSQDTHGHGTAVAGIDAGVAPNAKIIPIQVTGASGSTTTAAVGDALEWIADNAAKYKITAVNLSFSDGKNWITDGEEVLVGDSIRLPLDRLDDLGIPVFVAAGNNYDYYKSPGLSGPAAYETTVGVGAIASDGLSDSTDLWYKSQRREDAFYAPGVGLTTAKLNGDTQQWQGTSISTPFASGASLLIQNVANKYLKRKLTGAELEDVLFRTSDEVNGQKHINVHRAAESVYNQAQSLTPSGGSEFLFERSDLEQLHDDFGPEWQERGSHTSSLYNTALFPEDYSGWIGINNPNVFAGQNSN